MATASSNHELSTEWTSEEEEMCTKFQSIAITQLSTAPIKNEINSEMVKMVWHVNEEDIWSLSVEETKSTDLETQMKRVPFRK